MTRTINNVTEDGTIVEPICLTCDHTYGYNWPETCKAYPNGIPQEIVDGKVDHTKPYPGDNGIVYRGLYDAPIAEIEARFNAVMDEAAKL